MPDTKTSDFPSASTITGDEIVGIVQGGYNVQTTTNDFVFQTLQVPKTFTAGLQSYVIPNSYSIAIGYHAAAIFTSNIAIGPYAYALGSGSIAIGERSAAHGSDNTIAIGRNAHANSTTYGVAIGYDSEVTNKGIALGAYAQSTGLKSISIGYSSESTQDLSIAIGSNQLHVNNANVIAIGSYMTAGADYTIMIGRGHTATQTHAMAIGTKDTHATGTFATAITYGSQARGSKSIAFGHNSYTGYTATYSVAIGSGAAAHCKETVVIGYSAVGKVSASNYSVVIGCNSYVIGYYGVAIGCAAKAAVGDVAIGAFAGSGGAPGNSVAVGYSAHNANQHAVSIGFNAGTAGTQTAAIGHDAYAGVGNSVALGAGASANASGATALGSFAIASGVSSISIGVDANAGHYAAMTFGPFVTSLGSGTFNIGSAAPFAATSPVDRFVKLAARTNGSSVQMTADGGARTSENQIRVPEDSGIGTISGRVTATTTDFFNGGGTPGDCATFVMSPVVIHTRAGGTHEILGTPTFTIENNTAGASGWAVPVFSIDVTNSCFSVTVPDQGVTVNWMAHFKLDSN